MHKIDLQLFYRGGTTTGINYDYDKRFQSPVKGGINIDYDKRFQSPTNTNNSNKDTDRLRSMGGGSDVRGVPTAEKTYRAQQRNNTITTPKLPSYQGIGRIGQFQASQSYLDAMNYTNQLLGQLNSGRTAYSDKIDALMSQIENRDKFSYDFNTDPLFQNALSSAMVSGQNAMQDTIGQASALTGGYGSSYATSAANQAYNFYIQDAYASLPQYYGLALDAYNQEGQDLYNQLGMYQTADSTAYDRLYSAYSANLSNAQNIYNQEYQNYWDTANYNYNVDKYNADQKYNYDMAQYNAQKEQYDTYLSQFSAYNGGTSSKSSGATGNDASDTSDSTITFSQFNTLKSDVNDMVKRYGADSSRVDELILQFANNYNLSEQQIAELYSNAASNDAQKKYTLSKAPNGNPVYKDQYGKTYQGSQSQITFHNISTPSGGTKTSDQAKYADDQGNELTYAELKARGWTKYIK